MLFRCPACHSTRFDTVETVPVEALATAWARNGAHSAGSDAKRIGDYIVADLGAERVEFRQCLDCGLEIAEPMRSWSAAHYPETKHVLGFDHQIALADLAKLPPARVLDIGCADGQFLAAAQKSGHEVYGIDFTAADIRAAQARGVNALVADVSEVESKFSVASKFNVITLFQIIEHLNEPDEIFTKINSIAASDALLIVGCPSDLRYSRVFAHENRVNRSDFWDYPPQHTLRWTAQALKVFLTRHGWQVERTIYEPFQILGAAAHLTELHASAQGWPARTWRKRATVVQWLARMTLAHLTRQISGIRQVVTARRAATS